MKRAAAIPIVRNSWVDLDRSAAKPKTRLVAVDLDRMALVADCPRFMTVGYIAEFLLLSPKTVYELIREGRLACELIGNRKRIHRTQLAAFLLNERGG